MGNDERQRELESALEEAEAQWLSWLRAMFRDEHDPRYMKTVELLDIRLNAADALAGYMVERAMKEEDERAL